MTYFLRYLRIVLAGLFLTGLAQISSAQNIPEDTRLQALELAAQIENESLVFDNNWALDAVRQSSAAPDKQLRLIRSIITSAVAEGEAGLLEQVQAYRKIDQGENDTGIVKQVETYRSIAQNFGTKRDQDIAKFFDVFISHYSTANGNSDSNDLSEYYNHPDWFVRHRASYFKGLLSPQASTPSVALQFTQDTFDLIPEENSQSIDVNYVLEAKILSLLDLAYFHNLLGNPELSVPTTVEAIRLQKSIGEPINGSSLINNLIFAFSMWRDHETVKALTETLLRLEEKSGSEEPGLTELRAASVYIATGDFRESLEFANKAIASAELEGVKLGASLDRMIALASLGRTSQAAQELRTFEQTVPEGIRNRGSFVQKTFHIKALLAEARGDKNAADRYTTARIDSSIQDVFKRNNSETANMLASLQNSKERRSEREDALEREAELKQVALDRQRGIIWLLFALAAILAILTASATAFARFRSKAAQAMSVAADKAKAGEKAKSEFLAVMSHELRTPLNGILGMADVLSRTAPNESIKAKNDIILKSGNELLALVENIFDMTLIESGDLSTFPTEINVHDLITRQTEEWRADIEAKDIIFTVHIDPSVPEKMELDRDRFRQCLKNLLSNAAKFTDAGRVHVHAMGKPGTGKNTGDTELTIIVADTGVGISEDAKSRLFKPFVQADYSMTREFGGAGLGLAITRNLAQLMGGDVTVNSRENRGSEFALTLKGKVCEPVIIEKPAVEIILSPAAPVSNKKPSRQEPYNIACFGQKFLIVDDDIPSQNVVQTLLEPTGAHMTCVTNGQAALDALIVETFDVVIMDIRMPGMDGVTTVRRIRESREAHNKVPIIALTADVTPETNTKCLIAGVDVYLTKPVKAEDFYEAVEYVNKRAEKAERKQA